MNKHSDNDTIAAIATPLGQAGIGIVRLSGPRARDILGRIFQANTPRPSLENHRLYLGHVLDPTTDRIIDEVLVSIMTAPHSYTREDVAEINSHSGYTLLSKILGLVLDQGARLARPGEFTFRAFKNGRLDLTQAEAVMDLIHAKSEKGLALAARQLQGSLSAELEKLRRITLEILAQVEAQIDFPEETSQTAVYETDLIRRMEEEVLPSLTAMAAGFAQRQIWLEGVKTLILGRVNVGKSSLLNHLAQEERAIVTPIPGTTRDIIESMVHISGVPFRIMDTAGFRKAKGTVEIIGQRLTRARLQEADLVLLIFDQSRPLHAVDRELLSMVETSNVLLILNKIDLPAKLSIRRLHSLIGTKPLLRISALTGHGLDALRRAVLEKVLGSREPVGDTTPFLPNLRHKQALDRAKPFLEKAVAGLKTSGPLEIIADDLQQGLQALGEITGEITPDEVLEKIFSQFCIGK